ncbi:uncharacterized protein HMPREF1541_06425 [Cyphellophora europaea CBS 101466]|uniref:Uncharacterized protein n=1 Tax=Cyphellophora europaea (strain CBS 101466) TaxID=1220924 RepID=W2RQ28_CYPE1|nr:uncharacterized protein HMPREF1541_06425 [Cyphellophora europaea CBS 101466]ETN38390.1 hypothetical protein HMPREF1541_06425 [Cyphellophora europaea CBS 101466]
MPPLPGEERLVTVYADIHYYFAPPTVRPVLHRFDKASYFYIYHNSTRGFTRIEVANNPGTPDQDAFNGQLDNCRIINSHKFPTLMTLVVDGAGSGASSPSSRQARDPEEWRLLSADPRDTGKSKYRLHTLDIYFWAQEDAKLVVDNLRGLLQPAQLDIVQLEPEPEPEPEPAPVQNARADMMSPLVQNLENVAISDPAYQNGQTRNSQNHPQAVNLPPPPPTNPHQSTNSISPQTASPQSTTRQEQPQAFVPMAYDPAAPPAPEPIAHREDTPPPPDDGHGTGLAAAAIHDQRPYQPGQPPSQAYHPGQPSAQPYQPGVPSSQPWTGGPPTATQQRYTSPFTAPPPQSTPLSFAGPPNTASPAIGATSTTPSRHGSTAAAQYVPDRNSQSYQPTAHQPVETPGSQFYNTLPNPVGTSGSVSPHKPLQHVQPQYMDYLSSGGGPPPGGYAHFNYGAASQQGMLPAHMQAQQQNQQHQGGSPYDVHGQVYRPTEAEAQAYHEKHHGKRPSKSGSHYESRTEKGEKKVSGWMKKLESKVGL